MLAEGRAVCCPEEGRKHLASCPEGSKRHTLDAAFTEVSIRETQVGLWDFPFWSFEQYPPTLPTISVGQYFW